MPPKVPESMQYRENRLETFENGAFQGKSKQMRYWTHSRPTPEVLADHGFFFTPTKLNQDQVTCCVCRKKETNVEGVENMAMYHLENNPECPLATIISLQIQHILSESTLEEFWKDEALGALKDPLSKNAINMRKKTYGLNWKYDYSRADLSLGKVPIKPIATSTALANAGFYYCPLRYGNDRVQCVYCNCSLDTWLPSDNPMDEHRQNAINYCYFLDVIDNQSNPKTNIKRLTPSIQTQNNIITISDSEMEATASESDEVPPVNNRSTKRKSDNSVIEENQEKVIPRKRTRKLPVISDSQSSSSSSSSSESESDSIIQQDDNAGSEKIASTPSDPVEEKLDEIIAISSPASDTSIQRNHDAEKSREMMSSPDLEIKEFDDHPQVEDDMEDVEVEKPDDSEENSSISESSVYEDDSDVQEYAESKSFLDDESYHDDVDEEEDEEEINLEVPKRRKLRMELTKDALDEDDFKAPVKTAQKKPVKNSKKNQKPITVDDVNNISFDDERFQQILTSPKKNKKIKINDKKITSKSPSLHDISNHNLGDYEEDNLEYLEKHINIASENLSPIQLSPEPRNQPPSIDKVLEPFSTALKPQLLNAPAKISRSVDLKGQKTKNILDMSFGDDIFSTKGEEINFDPIRNGGEAKPIQTQQILEDEVNQSQVAEDSEDSISDSMYIDAEDSLNIEDESHGSGTEFETRNILKDLGSSNTSIKNNTLDTKNEKVSRDEVKQSDPELGEPLENSTMVSSPLVSHNINETNTDKVNLKSETTPEFDRSKSKIISSDRNDNENIIEKPTKEESPMSKRPQSSIGSFDPVNFGSGSPIDTPSKHSVGNSFKNAPDIEPSSPTLNNSRNKLPETSPLGRNSTMIEETLDTPEAPSDRKNIEEGKLGERKSLTLNQDITDSFNRLLESSTPQKKTGNENENEVKEREIYNNEKRLSPQIWKKASFASLLDNLNNMETASQYLHTLSTSKFELNDDYDGELTSFISNMPEEEEEMTLQQWIRSNAANCRKLLEQVCTEMIDSYTKECERAMTILQDLPTED